MSVISTQFYADIFGKALCFQAVRPPRSLVLPFVCIDLVKYHERLEQS